MAMQDNFVEIVIMAGFSSNGQQDSLAKYRDSCGYEACHFRGCPMADFLEGKGGLLNLEHVRVNGTDFPSKV